MAPDWQRQSVVESEAEGSHTKKQHTYCQILKSPQNISLECVYLQTHCKEISLALNMKIRYINKQPQNVLK